MYIGMYMCMCVYIYIYTHIVFCDHTACSMILNPKP